MITSLPRSSRFVLWGGSNPRNSPTIAGNGTICATVPAHLSYSKISLIHPPPPNCIIELSYSFKTSQMAPSVAHAHNLVLAPPILSRYNVKHYQFLLLSLSQCHISLIKRVNFYSFSCTALQLSQLSRAPCKKTESMRRGFEPPHHLPCKVCQLVRVQTRRRNAKQKKNKMTEWVNCLKKKQIDRMGQLLKKKN